MPIIMPLAKKEVIFMSFYDFTVINIQGQPVSLAGLSRQGHFSRQHRLKMRLHAAAGPAAEIICRLSLIAVLSSWPSHPTSSPVRSPKKTTRSQPITPKNSASISRSWPRPMSTDPDAIPLYNWLRHQKGGLFGRKIKWNFYQVPGQPPGRGRVSACFSDRAG